MSQRRTNASTSSGSVRGGGGGRGGGGARGGGGGGRGGGRARGGNSQQNNNNRNQQGPTSSGFNPKANYRGNKGQNGGQSFKPQRGRPSNRGSNNAEPSSWSTVAANFVLEHGNKIIDFGLDAYKQYSTNKEENKTNNSNFPDVSDNNQPQTSFNSPQREYYQPSSEERHHYRPDQSTYYENRTTMFDSSHSENHPYRSGYHAERRFPDGSNYYYNSSTTSDHFHYQNRHSRGGTRFYGDMDFSREPINNSFQNVRHDRHDYLKEKFQTRGYNNYKTNRNMSNNGNESNSSLRNNLELRPDNNFTGNHVSSEPVAQSSADKGSSHKTNTNHSGSYKVEPVTSTKSKSPVQSKASEGFAMLKSAEDPSILKDSSHTSNITKSDSSVAATTNSKSPSRMSSSCEFEDLPMLSNSTATKVVRSRSIADIEKRKAILHGFGWELAADNLKGNVNGQTKNTESENKQATPIQNSEENHVPEVNVGDSIVQNENEVTNSEKSLGENFIAQIDKMEKLCQKNVNAPQPINSDHQESEENKSSMEASTPSMLNVDLLKQLHDFKKIYSQKRPSFPGQTRRKNRSGKIDKNLYANRCRKGFTSLLPTIYQEENPNTDNIDNLTPGQFSGVPHFNIQRPAADRHQQVSTESETRRRIQREHDEKAAEHLEKEKEKEARKREQYLAKYKYVDQGYRMTEGPLDKNGFDQTQALMSEEEVRQMQQHRLHRDASVYQLRQEEESKRQKVNEAKKHQEWLDKQKHINAGYRLGSGDGRGHSQEEMSYLDEQYDNDYNEDLYGDYVQEQQSQGALNPQYQHHENAFQRQGDRSEEERTIGFEHWQGAGRDGARSPAGRRNKSPTNRKETGLLKSISPELMLEGETEEEFLQRQEEQLTIELLIRSQQQKEDDEEDMEKAIELSMKEAGAGNSPSSVSRSSGISGAMKLDPMPSVSNEQTIKPSAPPMTSAVKPSSPGFVPSIFTKNNTSDSSKPVKNHIAEVLNSSTANLTRPSDPPVSASQSSGSGMSFSVKNTTLLASFKPTNDSTSANYKASSASSLGPAASTAKPASQTFNDMRKFFIPNSNNKPSSIPEPNAANKSGEAGNRGLISSPSQMIRSQSQPCAMAATPAVQTPASKVLRSHSQAPMLVLRATEKALNKELAEKLAIYDEMEKQGHSSIYKPNVQQENRLDMKYQTPVDIGRATGAIPKQKTPTSPPAPAPADNQREIDYQAEMRAARLRMQQKYEESLKKKQENQDSA